MDLDVTSVGRATRRPVKREKLARRDTEAAWAPQSAVPLEDNYPWLGFSLDNGSFGWSYRGPVTRAQLAVSLFCNFRRCS